MALAEEGRAAMLEFVPNEDRASPPATAMFSMVMLTLPPGVDAYTLTELERMFQSAGFSRSELYQLPPTFEQMVISYK